MPPVLAYARVPEVDLLAAYDGRCGRLGLISVNLGWPRERSCGAGLIRSGGR
jgi:hypothetical protein